jgi:hypothetical protein
VTAHETLTPLLDLDPDVGRLLTAERAGEAHAQLGVRVTLIPRGPWQAERLAAAHPENIGLLVLDGVIAREVLIADTVSTELIGAGDIVRPWHEADAARLLVYDVRWTALAEVRLAVLDRRFAARLPRFPEINAMLMERLTERAQRMAVSQAVSQLNGVDRRLLALFWQLAERWGRITSSGVAIPMTLSHRVLAQLVGARRPTVSTALAELTERHELVRRDDGTWLLLGDPVGMPRDDVTRAVEHRRALMARESGEAAPDVPNGRPVEPPPIEDITMRLERLRRTSDLQLQVLRESRDTATELCRIAATLRQQRRSAAGAKRPHVS